MELGNNHSGDSVEVVPSEEQGFFVVVEREGEFVTKAVGVWGRDVSLGRLINGDDDLSAVLPPVKNSTGTYDVPEDVRISYRVAGRGLYSSRGPARIVEAVPSASNVG